jgi:hypothetical protein
MPHTDAKTQAATLMQEAAGRIAMAAQMLHEAQEMEHPSDISIELFDLVGRAGAAGCKIMSTVVRALPATPALSSADKPVTEPVFRAAHRPVGRKR